MRGLMSSLLLGAFILFSCMQFAWANSQTALLAAKQPTRIITLAPHLTEWIYSLQLDEYLVAVSDYSNYPDEAKSLPIVADYQGVDIKAIMALHPTLIVAWEGGNKPQDLHRLADLGFTVFHANVTHIEDIAAELIRLGKHTNRLDIATKLANEFIHQLNALQLQYATPSPKNVFYYSWTSPLMTVGPNAWPNKLLNVCGAQTLFDDSPVDYPQVSLQQVLSRQPDALVAASTQPIENLENFWASHRNFLPAQLIKVDPDVTSRFSLRLINELKSLCKGIN